MPNSNNYHAKVLVGLVLWCVFLSARHLPADVIFEDFESGISAPSDPTPSIPAANPITYLVDTTNLQAAPNSSNSLKIVYTNPIASYTYEHLLFGKSADLRNCKELQLWVKGDGTTNKLVLYLVEAANPYPADGEWYKIAQEGVNPTAIPLSNTNWQLYRFPLTQQSATTDGSMWFAGAFGPDGSPAQFEDAHFSANLGGYILMVCGSQQITNSTIYIDDLKGVGETSSQLIDNYERNEGSTFTSAIEYAVELRRGTVERDWQGLYPGSPAEQISLQLVQSAAGHTPIEGNQFLDVNYRLEEDTDSSVAWIKLLGGKEWDASKNYRRCQDWSGYDGISFWYIGDGPYGANGPYGGTSLNPDPLNNLQIRVDARGQYTADSDWWSSDQADKFPSITKVPLEVNAASYTWKQRYVPFSMLGKHSNVTDPFESHRVLPADLKAVKLLTFAIREADGRKAFDNTSATQKSVYFDAIEVYSTTAASSDKVYRGILQKQNTMAGKATYLLPSFDGKVESHTYDNALAAICYIFNGQQDRARNLLDVYKNLPAGYYYGYKAYTSDGSIQTMKVDFDGKLGKGVGPNAYIMLAMMFYKGTYSDTSYDAAITALANWIADQQAADGHIQWGYDYSGAARTEGSVEINLDVYGAFKKFSSQFGNVSIGTITPTLVDTRLTNIQTWLNLMWGDWDSDGRKRFKVGDSVANIDRSLDCYALAPLAILPFSGGDLIAEGWSFSAAELSSALNYAESDLGNTQYSLFGGETLAGFDFGGNSGAGIGNPTLKDGIWFEGTGQMALAYDVVANGVQYTYYVSQIEKGITDMIAPGCQGIAYATPFIPSQSQGPTAYGGWPMDVSNSHTASECWYYFAKNKLNPFNPQITAVFSGQSMQYAVDVWPIPSDASYVTLANGGKVSNNHVVRMWAPITDGPNRNVRIYYTILDPKYRGKGLDTAKDMGGDAGTSYYKQGIYKSTVGGFQQWCADLKTPVNNCAGVVTWKPCGSLDSGVTWTENGSMWEYSVTVTPGILRGDVDRNVQVGNNYSQITVVSPSPYPLTWNATYFDTTFEQYYSPLRHTPDMVGPVSDPKMFQRLMTLMNPTSYYFMPNNVPATSANFDVYKLNPQNFTYKPTSPDPNDNRGDLFYSENPYLYVRAAYGDVVVGSSQSNDSAIRFTYDKGPPWSPPISNADYDYTQVLSFYSRDDEMASTPWFWLEDVAPNSASFTEAQKHLSGFTLHYDFLHPANYGSLSSMPEDCKIYYFFRLCDETDINTLWRKNLFSNGVFTDPNIGSGTPFYFYMLQDDYSRPYVVANVTDLGELQPSNVTDPPGDLASWLTDYNVTAPLYDMNDGAFSWDTDRYCNIAKGRGRDSGIFAGNAAATGSAGSPVHDTRVYYRITSDAPTIMAGYNVTDRYLTPPDHNYIPDNAPEGNATYTFQGSPSGWVQMDGPQGGGTWSATIPFSESDIGKYVYYRIYACNNDRDPQGFNTPSRNIISGGVATIGGRDMPAINNKHTKYGPAGTRWPNPYAENLTAADEAKDSDQDHGWVMYTRYGGKVSSPKMIKISATVTVGNSKRTIEAYLNGEGGIGNILSIERKKK